ncbi:MAG: hypothetical protein HY221_01180 [Candidatus Sungbacteria bacterium]|uniref:Uncharacterized protein n=1 Tax=Candidatus Sungiibacteriota bacterium TaxID=2750080 RepID=A0A932QY20_9BACT|nr:hypothetical protein [Candidatus Sungbacteria bacterium]
MTTPEKLVEVLKGIASIGQRAPAAEIAFGPPCGHLIEEGLEKGVRLIAIEMLNPFRNPGHFSLNDGGSLKLHYRQFSGRLLVHVSDEYGLYRATVGAIQNLLDKEGLWREL